jgi:hypothetical protein
MNLLDEDMDKTLHIKVQGLEPAIYTGSGSANHLAMASLLFKL